LKRKQTTRKTKSKIIFDLILFLALVESDITEVVVKLCRSSDEKRVFVCERRIEMCCKGVQ